MTLKNKLKDAIDSIVLGRPVYLCEFPNQLGVAYYKVSINNASRAVNGPLTTIPLVSSELEETKTLIAQAREVFKHRCLVQEKQNALYNTLTPLSFKAAVLSSLDKDDIVLTLNVVGEVPTFDSLENLLLTFTSELEVEYNIGIVSLIRHTKDKFTIRLPYPKDNKSLQWVLNAKGLYTITRKGYVPDEVGVLGPALPGVS